MYPNCRTDRLVMSSGIMIEGIIDTMHDPISYDINFYEEGKKIFSYRYPASEDPYADRPAKMSHVDLCEVVGHIIEYLKRVPERELVSKLSEEYYNWLINNRELFDGFYEECKEILRMNEGWEHYAKIRVL